MTASLPSHLCIQSSNTRLHRGLAGAAERKGVRSLALDADPGLFGQVWQPGYAVRAPNGYLAQVQRLGFDMPRMLGPSPEWFVSLDPSLLGREWRLLSAAEALSWVDSGPTIIKLADAKHPLMPLRKYSTTQELSERLAAVGAREGIQLLATRDWLQIHSEYRIFTRETQASTVSPYLIEDDIWSFDLPHHPRSFHAEAQEFLAETLLTLGPDTPPGAAIDVARLENGKFVILEANQCWSAALYGCSPDRALESILACNVEIATASSERWIWHPDPGLNGH
jgi:hypothetical protein